MASSNLGRVGIVPRGAWDNATQYDKLDLVSYDGNAWLALRTNTNVTPNTTNTDDWQLISNNADLVSTVQGYKNDAETAAGNASASASAAASSAAEATDALANEAAEFDTSVYYYAGNYVIYDDGSHKYTYRFTADHPAGAWIGTDAEQVTICGEITPYQGLSTRIDKAGNFVDYGYDVQSSYSSTSGALTISTERTGTKFTVLNASAGVNTTAFCVRINGQLDGRLSMGSYKDLGGGIVLENNHIYRWSMKLLSGTANTSTWAARVYKHNAESPLACLNTDVTLPDGTSYYDFVYTNEIYPEGVKLSLYISRKTDGINFSNAVFDCYLEDITYSGYYDNYTGTFSSGKYFDLSGAVGTVVNAFAIDADYCYQKVPCQPGDVFVYTGYTETEADEAIVYGVTNTENVLRAKAGKNKNANAITLNISVDGYLLVNALVNSPHFLVRKVNQAKIPAPPTADGTYNLVCNVSNGEIRYNWETVTRGGALRGSNPDVVEVIETEPEEEEPEEEERNDEQR